MKKITFIVLLMIFSLGYSKSISSEEISCTTISKEAEQGSFSIGYKLKFETIGTDVKITCELLDTDRVGVIAYLFKNTPFGETPMTNESGLIFTKTITGQTLDETITYAVKFAFAGGLAVTKYTDYKVGQDCELGVNNFELSKSVKLYPNPAKGILNIDSNRLPISKIEFYSIIGNKILETKENYNLIHIEDLSKGVYLVKVYMENNKVAIKRLIVE